MADLPILADRMNDIEVAANAPLTEALMRKYGSNVNYLLDFLGIPDGSTSVAGTLQDFILAVEEVSTHTPDVQVTMPSAGVSQAVQVGQYSPNKFVNEVFYIKYLTGVTNDIIIPPPGVIAGPAGGNDLFFYWNIDGGSNIPANDLTTQYDNGGAGVALDTINVSVTNSTTFANYFTKAYNIGANTVATNDIYPIFEIDYRDPATTFYQLFVTWGPLAVGASGAQIIRTKRLNVGGLSL